MHTEQETMYVCYGCGDGIVDQVYLVQRRRVRPLTETLPNGVVQENQADLLNSFHAGIQVGPEYDPHCPACFTKLPSVQELIDGYKSRLDLSS